MWDIISNIASVLSIISAVVTAKSAWAIKGYYQKIVSQYSFERITVVEQKAYEAKREYQKIKGMYANSRGTKQSTVASIYIVIDNLLDEISHSLPSGYDEIHALIKQARGSLNESMDDVKIMSKSDSFIDLGSYIDGISEKLKREKESLQKENIRNITRG